MRERRRDEATRRKFRQTQGILAKDLIMPVFIKEGVSGKKEIKSMPGIYQFSPEEAVGQAKKIRLLGIPAVILFGIPAHKDPAASSAYDKRGIVQQAIRAIKRKVRGLQVIADVCMCEYTSHGHCGIIKRSQGHGSTGSPSLEPSRAESRGKVTRSEVMVDNDETIKVLAKIAVSYAEAGADIVAPSAMMDGQVKAIKEALNKNNFIKTKIMAYSAKYASGFYGPFRDAAESAPESGDRKAYQMDYHNSDEAVLEARLDIAEGADMLMVKPALGYQDIIYRLKKELKFPLACYSVSGEYAMLKAAALKGYLDEKSAVLEALTGFKRAGADFIITYYAAEAAQKWLKNR